MISSMDLFFSLDWELGGWPAVEAPKLVPVLAADNPAVALVDGPAVAVVVEVFWPEVEAVLVPPSAKVGAELVLVPAPPSPPIEKAGAEVAAVPA